MFLTYLVAAHFVAVLPSQVWPLGHASHLFSLTYLGAAQPTVRVGMKVRVEVWVSVRVGVGVG